MKCGSYLVEPRLAPEAITPLYTTHYTRTGINPASLALKPPRKRTVWYTCSLWFEGNHRIQHDLDFGNKKILEIGCGDGKSLLELRALGHDVYGIDPDENVAAVRDYFNIPIHIGTIENAPFEKRSFDLIIANQLIEHILDLDSFIAHCKELLALGGYIAISTPNARSLWRRIWQRRWINWHIPYHQQIFTREALAELFARHGLAVTHVKTVTPRAWLIHQFHAIKNYPEQGDSSVYWNPKASSGKKSYSTGIAIKILLRLFFISENLFTKIADLFGHGDCIIIWAKERQQP